MQNRCRATSQFVYKMCGLGNAEQQLDVHLTVMETQLFIEQWVDLLCYHAVT